VLRRAALQALPVLTFVGMVVALYGAFIHVPQEKTMGDVQRIFYFHVACWWNSALALLVVFGASVSYLATRKRFWDTLAAASAEIATLFITLGLVLGMLWAKPVWGIYWTWDARLTTAAVLWLIYVSYLMLRNFVPDEERRANLAAVLGILGFVDVPIVYFSIVWWRTQHPAPVIAGGSGSGLDPVMGQGLLMSLVGFFFLYLWLLEKRIAVEHARQELDHLARELEVA